MLSNTSTLLPAIHRKNVTLLALHPRGTLLLSIDADGKAILTSLIKMVVLYYFTFKSSVSAVRFAPSGQYFSVAIDRRVQVWNTPTIPSLHDNDDHIHYSPFVKHAEYVGHFDVITDIHWSSDSRFMITASKDLTVRIWSLPGEVNFIPTVLSGHKDIVISAWFSQNQEIIWSLGKDGALFMWQFVTAESTEASGNDLSSDSHRTTTNVGWKVSKRYFYNPGHAEFLCSATFHAKTNLLIVGMSTGQFELHELPEFVKVQSLQVTNGSVSSTAVNCTGEWLAFGSSKLGQLLVWEWQSESYILKQQSNYDSINAIAYTCNGSRIVTVTEDAKIKLWDTVSGFCIVTFTEHTSSITACQFAKQGNVLFTASLDGSVRAWDLIRYRNFRTFTAPTNISFISLAVDPSGEVVCAGSLQSFEIHVWSVQTGQLLDRLASHQGPVSRLTYSPDGLTLASGSWDHTVRLWNIFNRCQSSEQLQLQSDILDITFHPDSTQLAIASLDGQITFWCVETALQKSLIHGQRDITGGRKHTDTRTAFNVDSTNHFTCITYSPDGSSLLAAGHSKYICLFNVESCHLMKKFTVSINLSLDGTQEYLNSKLKLDSGSKLLIDHDPEGNSNSSVQPLPGTKHRDPSLRLFRPEIRVSDIKFAPTGRMFCAATTEGLLIYSLDRAISSYRFDPVNLDVSVTPQAIVENLSLGNHLVALIMALRLNDLKLLRLVYEAIRPEDISAIVNTLPTVYIQPMLTFIAQQLDSQPHLEFALRWFETIFLQHGGILKEQSAMFAPQLRCVERAVGKVASEIENIAQFDLSTTDYLLSQIG